MQLTSSAFNQGGAIPSQYTGEGTDISPPLNWSDAPEGTQSFAVICHDPDAPLITTQGTYGFVHWTLYNIPASINHLAEATPEHTQGKSDFVIPVTAGRCLPMAMACTNIISGILALDSDREIEGGLTLWQLLERIEPNVIAMNRLVGTYQRD